MSKSDEEAQLYEELDEWLKWRNKQWDDLCSPARTVQTPKEFSKLLKSGHQNNAVMAQEARSFIPRLFCDNSHLSAEELEELASKLSPGSSHTGGWLASLVYNSLRWEVDPILIAATIRWNWHGGRGRFEFLPDPAESDTQDYQGLASDLIEFLQDATDTIVPDLRGDW